MGDVLVSIVVVPVCDSNVSESQEIDTIKHMFKSMRWNERREIKPACTVVKN